MSRNMSLHRFLSEPEGFETFLAVVISHFEICGFTHGGPDSFHALAMVVQAGIYPVLQVKFFSA